MITAFVKHVVFGSIVAVASFILPFFQFISLPLYYSRWRNTQRKLAGFLTQLHLSTAAIWSYYMGNVELNLVVNDETLQALQSDSSIWIVNHRSEMEIVFIMQISKYLQILSRLKAVIKKSLKHLPVVGWALNFMDCLMLERNFSKDQTTIQQTLQSYATYTDPIHLILFCEGTRFTAEKHVASYQFALQHNYKPMEYHLIPRTKGFHSVVTGMKDFVPWIHDVTFHFRGEKNPSIYDFLKMKPIKGNILIRTFPISKVPEDEKECGVYLRNLYYEKDQLYDFIEKNQQYPIRSREELKNHKIIPITFPKRYALEPLWWILFIGVLVCLCNSCISFDLIVPVFVVTVGSVLSGSTRSLTDSRANFSASQIVFTDSLTVHRSASDNPKGSQLI